MIVREAILLSIASVFLTPAQGKPLIYSNVVTSGITGDLDGIELRIVGGPQPSIDFVLCEGWCNSVDHLPIILRHGGFDFVYPDKACHFDGTVAGVDRWRFRARFWRKRLILRQLPRGQPDSLKRINRPFGLDVAEDNEREGRKSKDVIRC